MSVYNSLHNNNAITKGKKKYKEICGHNRMNTVDIYTCNNCFLRWNDLCNSGFGFIICGYTGLVFEHSCSSML